MRADTHGVSSYRCLGCREYHTRPEHRRVGLGSVCSDQCDTQARRPAARKRAAPGATPATRATVLDRDGACCRFCGTTNGLHAHHVVYRSQGKDDTATNLITLCGDHHAVVHSDKRRWQPVCRAYIDQANKGRLRFLPEIDREING